MSIDWEYLDIRELVHVLHILEDKAGLTEEEAETLKTVKRIYNKRKESNG